MDVMLIFDVVIAIFGVYMIGAALKMKKTGKISSAVITAEEIYLLVCHCVTRSEERYGPGRRPTLRQIEKEG